MWPPYTTPSDRKSVAIIPLRSIPTHPPYESIKCFRWQSRGFSKCRFLLQYVGFLHISALEVTETHLLQSAFLQYNHPPLQRSPLSSNPSSSSALWQTAVNDRYRNLLGQHPRAMKNAPVSIWPKSSSKLGRSALQICFGCKQSTDKKNDINNTRRSCCSNMLTVYVYAQDEWITNGSLAFSERLSPLCNTAKQHETLIGTYSTSLLLLRQSYIYPLIHLTQGIEFSVINPIIRSYT